jgi:putative ABC transport system permease protein
VGFRRDGIARLAVSLSREDAGDPAARHKVFERVRDAVAAYPGVERVGLVAPTLPPWDSQRSRIRFSELDSFAAPDGLDAGVHLSDSGLLPALEIPLLEGRNFDETDGPGSAPVAIISAGLAALLRGPSRAIGREIEFVGADMVAGRFRVVGVARDVAYDGLIEQGTGRYIRYDAAGDAPGPRLDVYVPLARVPVTTISIAAVTSGDDAAMIEPLRREIARVVPTSAVHWTSTMSDEIGLEYAPNRFYALLVGAFSISALALTSAGLFALLSHAATRRSAEMGIRLALGATPRQVALLLLRGSFPTLIAGALLGLLGAAWASTAMRGLLYDVAASDGHALAGALAALGLVACAAGLVPARRVARVDPVSIIKGE